MFDYPLDTLVYLWLGAMAVGIGKGGVPGLGNIAAPLFAMVWASSRESVGILLPVLMTADVVAVLVYRRHAEWPIVWRLFPWMAVGVVAGAFAIGRMDDGMVKLFLGWLMLVLAALELLRRWLQRNLEGKDNPLSRNKAYGIGAGFAVGFTSTIANAAGPIGQIYMLTTGLPKLAFIGTIAWLFMLLNWFKVPFLAVAGVLSLDTLKLSLILAPAAVLGALMGPPIAKRIPQKQFVALIWIFVVVSGLKLIF